MNRKDPEIFISESERVETSTLEKVARLPELHLFPYRARYYHKGKSTNCKSTILIVCLPFHSIGELIHLS